MRLAYIALAFGVCAAAQESATLRGPYHFVRISVREEAGGKLTVRSGGGTVMFDGQGAYKMAGHAGANREAASALNRAGTVAAGPNASVRITGLWDPKETIAARVGDSGSMIVGSGSPNARTHDLFVAVRAPEGQVPAMSGTYAGGYGAVLQGEPGGLTSGYAEIAAGPAGMWTRLMAIAHTSGVDDVNRREEAKEIAYTLGAGGVGKTALAALDDTALTGEHVLLLSGNGEVLLSYATGAGRRQVMALVKKPAEQVTWMFTGPYWVGEIGGESPYRFQPSAVTFSSGMGALQAGGDGSAAIAESINAGGRTLRLATVNQYRIGTDGSSAFGPKISNAQRNFAVNEGAAVFSAAEVGAPGELTLAHGFVVGMKARGVSANLFPQLPRAPVGAGIPLRQDFRPVSPAQPARAGETLVLLAAGLGAPKPGSPVHVRFGGREAEVKYARCVVDVVDLWLIHAVVPVDVAGAAVPVVVQSAEATLDLVDVAIAR